ncbi:DUF4412 domain-containing protein [Polaribacter vadi]|uniref:DUF4412 domain-containing protein n=1 Tax=Polaribacter TaxID=52959 RepID=UPI001C0913EC|nr:MULTISPECIES: DUF4412 domain-containing protein [Polaribacter]MBU3011534.1 DUF4412 domain-containing protein [Polaribacter vadi]MDO6741347.1 DUF4412 domain-containing protein [Polaribacter sp. 1_MG-2023]
MKISKKIILSFLFLSLALSTNAQLWKKLKKKAQQKLENKIEKEADKKVDSILYGKKKTSKTEEPKTNIVDDRLKSYGSASINHTSLYGSFSVNDVSKTKVNKEANKIKIEGSWRTSDADVFDGYILTIINLENIADLNNKTFKIPEEATLKLAYNALVKGKYTYERGQEHAPQNFELISGTATITFNKDKNVSLNFSGDAKIDNHKDNEGFTNNTSVSINGMINTTEPEYTITKELKSEEKDPVDALSEDEKMAMFSKVVPTVNIPSTFSFNKSIELKMTDDRGDSQNIVFLTGSYPDIYGISLNSKEMQGQEMLVVNTPKSSTMFMNMAGMKIKKSTSLAQMGNQFDMEDKLPEEGDFEYIKTGNTKTIIGYLCEEVKVDYDYTNSKGSVTFWVSEDFPIQNKALPMLGMKMNNPYFSGFVLEMNSHHQGKEFTMQVVNISDKSVNINTNDYKKMGF